MIAGLFVNSTRAPIKPFSDEQARVRHHGVTIVRIYDIDTPNDLAENKTRSLDRKMWVKIKTYIFNEDFPLRGHPNIRGRDRTYK